jgi:crossover junction endodeoxyribonuclease RuvC
MITAKVAAIDLSLTGTGIAHTIVDTAPMLSLVKLGIPTGQATGGPLRDRPALLDEFADNVARAVTHSGVFAGNGLPGGVGGPEFVAIETPALSKARGGVFERGYVWYRVVGLLQVQGITVVGVSPGQIKQYVTGKGNASKGAVIDGLARRFPAFEHGGDEDLADAAGAAALLCAVLGYPLAKLPAVHNKPVVEVRKAAGL